MTNPSCNPIYLVTGLAYLSMVSSFFFIPFRINIPYFSSQNVVEPIKSAPLEPLESLSKNATVDCIIYGDRGCEFACQIKCQMYGCSSIPSCGHQQSCDCGETYEFDNQLVSAEYMKTWSFEEGWNFRFQSNAASITIKNMLQEEPRTCEAILTILREPHITGTQLLNKLLGAFPEAEILKQLVPIVRGKIDLFVNANRRFNFDAFKAYVARYTTSKLDQLQDLDVRPLFNIEEVVKTEQLIRSLVKQLLLFPSPITKTIIRMHAQVLGFSYDEYINSTDLRKYTDPDSDHELTSQQIDEIVQSGALNQLLELEEMPKFPLGAVQPQFPLIWV